MGAASGAMQQASKGCAEKKGREKAMPLIERSERGRLTDVIDCGLSVATTATVVTAA